MKKINQDYEIVDNKLILDISKINKNIKIIRASLKLYVTSSENINFVINYSCDGIGDETSWNNVDTVSNIASGSVITVDISDELQNSLSVNATKLYLTFESSTALTIGKCEKLSIEYISRFDYKSHHEALKFEVGQAGSAGISLSMGDLQTTTPLLTTSDAPLPIRIDAHYNSNRIDRDFNNGLPLNWNLNVNQFIFKNEDDSLPDFTYINENGNEELIEEKYYVIKSGTKIPVNKKSVFIDSFGELRSDFSIFHSVGGIHVTSNSTLIKKNANEIENFFKQISKLKKTDIFLQINDERCIFNCSDLKIVDMSYCSFKFNNYLNDYINIEIHYNPQDNIPVENTAGQVDMNTFIITTNKIFDGEIKFLCNTSGDKVYTSHTTESGLHFIPSNKEYEGYKFIDYEPEELAQQRANLELLSDNLSNSLENRKEIIRQLSILALNRENIIQQLYLQDFNCKMSGKELDYLNNIKSSKKNLVGNYDDNDNNEIARLDYNFTYGENGTKSFKQKAFNIMNKLRIAVDKKNFSTYFNEHIKIDFQDKSEALSSLWDELKATGKELKEIWENSEDNATEDNATEDNDVIGESQDTSKENEAQRDREAVGVDYKDIYSLDLQIQSGVYQFQQLEKNITKLNEDIKKTENKILQLEMQVPVHYLYDDNNIIYGYGKTDNENIFRLVLITDPYENLVSFNYNNLIDNRIQSITDSAGGSIVFNYNEDGYLEKIIDSRDRAIEFQLENSLLKSIKHINGSRSYFYYEKDSLSCIVNSNGLGIKFEYNNDKITKATNLSLLDKVENNILKLKDFNLGNISDFSAYILPDNVVQIEYNNLRSTTLTNAKGKSITYLFDGYGRARTIYENRFNENKPENSVRVSEFNYKDDKISEKISIFPYSINYLKDNCFDETRIVYKDVLSMGQTICAMDNYPYKIKVFESHKMNNNMISVDMESNYINLVNSKDNYCKHKTFILSGWAKANSAFISEEDTEDYEYIKNRKFELRAEVKYNDNQIVVFKKSFDWRCADTWQYCAVPIKLENSKEIVEIKCFVDYSFNTGDIYFSDLEFKEADWEHIDYDEDDRIIKKESAHDEWIITYEYDKDSLLPKKEIITSKLDESKHFITTYEYTKQGKLLRVVDYNGLVQENVYNDKGEQIKKITYHIDQPSSKIYEEQTLDEKGKVTGTVNELGEENEKYEYVQGTDLVSIKTDAQGNKMAYAYSNDDTLLQQSMTINGIENTNTFGYNLDFLTSVEHNNFKIAYDYDNQGRISKVKLAGNDYLTKEYADNEETTALASGEKFRQVFDDNGNVLAVFYKNVEGEEKQIISNTYDIYGNITFSQDLLTQEDHKIYINKFGKPVKEETSQHGENISVVNEYDDSHSQLLNTTINVGEQQLFYNFSYDNSPSPQIRSIMLPNETEQFINYDKLGRVSSIDNDKFSKCFSYLKNGDHASNLVSKLDFVENGVKKDNLRYKYDTKGNIVEIRENNKLIARYKYDGLSRIIREDNAIFDKSTTFDYDEGGNIIQSLQYSYTLAENLDFETVVSENNYLYPLNGWRDQLQYFNGERFIYDGLGNPTQYRGKTLVWSYGRQLEYFDAVKDENGNIVKQLAKYNYNANGIRTSKTIYTDYLNCECKKENCDCKNSFTTQFFLNGNKIIKQHDCCNDLTFYYGVDGVTGFHIKNNVVDADYYYKKNAQNDIIGIYSTEDEQIARYSYDAWGNQIVEYLNNEGKFVAIEKDFEYNNISEINRFIAFKNPFRYRSYYYDFETNLYYLNSRYYDSEIGRFINADDIGNIDITGNSINGLNLYAYCLNNPVNDTDSNGAASWWQWLLFGIGALLVVAATVVVTVASGGTALGVFGTIVLGAAKGALIGVAIGSVVGITGGAIYSAVTGADLWESILGGFLIGFGAGAIIGAVIGASISGFQVYHAAQQWGSTATRSSFKNMVSHFNKHVVKEGHQYLGNNIVEYTKNAMKFFQSNQNLLKLTDSGNYVIRALFEGYKAGGFFNLIGKIFSFF